MLKILKKREDRPERKEETVDSVIQAAEMAAEEVQPENTEPYQPDEIGEIAMQEDIVETPGEEERQEGVTPEFRLEAESFAKGKELPSERLEEGIGMLKNIGEAWREGELTVELLDVVLRGLDYDKALGKAFAEGELKGRNTQIEEEYMRPEDSDGLPHPQGKGNAGRSAHRVASIFDLARDAG